MSKPNDVSEKYFFSQLEIHTTLSAEGVVLAGNLLYNGRVFTIEQFFKSLSE